VDWLSSNAKDEADQLLARMVMYRTSGKGIVSKETMGKDKNRDERNACVRMFVCLKKKK
jgi:hypothetical protein